MGSQHKSTSHKSRVHLMWNENAGDAKNEKRKLARGSLTYALSTENNKSSDVHQSITARIHHTVRSETIHQN